MLPNSVWWPERAEDQIGVIKEHCLPPRRVEQRNKRRTGSPHANGHYEQSRISRGLRRAGNRPVDHCHVRNCRLHQGVDVLGADRAHLDHTWFRGVSLEDPVGAVIHSLGRHVVRQRLLASDGRKCDLRSKAGLLKKSALDLFCGT